MFSGYYDKLSSEEKKTLESQLSKILGEDFKTQLGTNNLDKAAYLHRQGCAFSTGFYPPTKPMSYPPGYRPLDSSGFFDPLSDRGADDFIKSLTDKLNAGEKALKELAEIEQRQLSEREKNAMIQTHEVIKDQAKLKGAAANKRGGFYAFSENRVYDFNKDFDGFYQHHAAFRISQKRREKIRGLQCEKAGHIFLLLEGDDHYKLVYLTHPVKGEMKSTAELKLSKKPERIIASPFEGSAVLVVYPENTLVSWLATSGQKPHKIHLFDGAIRSDRFAAILFSRQGEFIVASQLLAKIACYKLNPANGNASESWSLDVSSRKYKLSPDTVKVVGNFLYIASSDGISTLSLNEGGNETLHRIPGEGTIKAITIDKSSHRMGLLRSNDLTVYDNRTDKWTRFKSKTCFDLWKDRSLQFIDDNFILSTRGRVELFESRVSTNPVVRPVNRDKIPSGKESDVVAFVMGPADICFFYPGGTIEVHTINKIARRLSRELSSMHEVKSAAKKRAKAASKFRHNLFSNVDVAPDADTLPLSDLDLDTVPVETVLSETKSKQGKTDTSIGQACMFELPDDGSCDSILGLSL